MSTSVGTPSKGVPAGGLHRELRSHERLSGRYRHHVGLGEPIVKEFSFRGGLIARRIYPRLVRPAGAVEAMARRGLALDLHPN
ncbi:MAG: hypothetical protein R3247_01370 [Rhodothermales bacterium]|nr:hypothetical protein [Rhodothermales bacterium]